MPVSSALSRSSTKGPHSLTIPSSLPRPSFRIESGVIAGTRRSADNALSRRAGVVFMPRTSQT